MTFTDQTRKTVPLIAKAAVKKGYITKEQLRQAIDLQHEGKKEGIPPSLPEIFVKTGMIPPDKMRVLYDLINPAKTLKTIDDTAQTATPESPTTEFPQVPDDDNFLIHISEDRLTARLLRHNDSSRPVIMSDVLARARAMGIVHGLAREPSLKSGLLNPDPRNPQVIARGTPADPGRPPRVEYRFDINHARRLHPDVSSDTQAGPAEPPRVEDGDLIAEKTPMIPPDSGVDVFGKPIFAAPLEDLMIRSGKGADVFEDRLKIFATVSGVPFLSVLGTVSVFPQVAFDRDYGVCSGPVERDACIRTSKTLTGEYPVSGGNIEAMEIRGARIDVLGSVSAELGITGTVIRAEGDITARYIRGCRIETCGSVFVENEIMDSTVVCSGVCVCRNSKIVASTIAATGGLKTLGIGTETSVPCTIIVGTRTHVKQLVDRLDQTIEQNREWMAKLEETASSLTDETKKVQQQIAPLVSFHKKAEQAIQMTEIRLAELKKKQRRKRPLVEEKNLSDLKAKDRSALMSLRTWSERLKEIQQEASGIPDEIRKRTEENAQLLVDRDAFLTWADTLSTRPLIEVQGSVAAGTEIKGLHADRILTKKYEHVRIEEKSSNKESPEAWSITLSLLD